MAGELRPNERQGAAIAPLLPNNNRPGAPRVDDHAMSGMCWGVAGLSGNLRASDHD
jgi:hypothetical protein